MDNLKNENLVKCLIWRLKGRKTKKILIKHKFVDCLFILLHLGVLLSLMSNCKLPIILYFWLVYLFTCNEAVIAICVVGWHVPLTSLSQHCENEIRMRKMKTLKIFNIFLLLFYCRNFWASALSNLQHVTPSDWFSLHEFKNSWYSSIESVQTGIPIKLNFRMLL